MADKLPMIPMERIEQAIILLRGEKVMLDADLAALYGVETRVLVQAVKRHQDRFPADFMFQLSRVEFDHLKSQFVTSESDSRLIQGEAGILKSQFVISKVRDPRGGRRSPPTPLRSKAWPCYPASSTAPKPSR